MPITITLAVFFIVAGIAHFIRPSFYLEIMPPALPRPLFWIYFTGLCEILGGVGVLIGPLRRAAGWGLIALLVCVLPANVQMLRQELVHGSSWRMAALVARLPLQFLLIYWVYAGANLGK
jgi:uncharacterized membrane protein